MRLRHELSLHDVITLTTRRGIQYGIRVLGIIDAFVYAHSHHHRNRDNPGNYEDCMEEPIRLMTALAPAYCPSISKLVSSKTPRRHFGGTTADSWLQGQLSVFTQYSHIFCVKVVMRFEVIEVFFLREEPTQTLETQRRDGTPSPALFLVSVTSCLALSSQLKHMWPML